MGKVIFRGFVPADDPIYKRGPTVLTTANLNPHWVKKQMEAAKRAAKAKATPISPATSKIPKELIAAYEATVFEVDIGGGSILSLKIGVHCPELDVYLLSVSSHEAAFITAFNPASIPLSERQNAAAQERLQKDVVDKGHQFIQGRGVDPTGTWPPEPSLLILSITRTEATALAEKFGQNAYVYYALGSAPDLVLLR